MSNSAFWGPYFEGDFEKEAETRESVLRAQISTLCSFASISNHLHWHDVFVMKWISTRHAAKTWKTKWRSQWARERGDARLPSLNHHAIMQSTK
jgi:hypothetical protein